LKIGDGNSNHVGRALLRSRLVQSCLSAAGPHHHHPSINLEPLVRYGCVVVCSEGTRPHTIEDPQASPPQPRPTRHTPSTPHTAIKRRAMARSRLAPGMPNPHTEPLPSLTPARPPIFPLVCAMQARPTPETPRKHRPGHVQSGFWSVFDTWCLFRAILLSVLVVCFCLAFLCSFLGFFWFRVVVGLRLVLWQSRWIWLVCSFVFVCVGICLRCHF